MSIKCKKIDVSKAHVDGIDMLLQRVDFFAFYRHVVRILSLILKFGYRKKYLPSVAYLSVFYN